MKLVLDILSIVVILRTSKRIGRFEKPGVSTIPKEERNYKYLAVIIVSTGGGTWSTGNTAEEAAESCARMCRSDWKHLFNIPKDHVFAVNVWNVEGIDKWRFDDQGAYEVLDEETGEERPLDKDRHQIVKTK